QEVLTKGYRRDVAFRVRPKDPAGRSAVVARPARCSPPAAVAARSRAEAFYLSKPPRRVRAGAAGRDADGLGNRIPFRGKGMTDDRRGPGAARSLRREQ